MVFFLVSPGVGWGGVGWGGVGWGGGSSVPPVSPFFPACLPPPGGYLRAAVVHHGAMDELNPFFFLRGGDFGGI